MNIKVHVCVQYFRCSGIYLSECEELHSLFITLFCNLDLTVREMFPVMCGPALVNLAGLLGFYLQCFSINVSTLGSPNSLALAKLAHAASFCFICIWAMPIRR